MLPRLVLLLLLPALIGCGSSGADKLEELGFEDPIETGLAGRLTWRGEVPPPPIPPIVPKACDGRPQVALLELGPEGGIAGALVRVPGAPGDLPDRVALRAEACVVAPRMAVAAPGATLEVSNGDDLVHTFHLRRIDGESERNVQVLAVPPGIPPLRWELDRPGLLHVTSDHFAWMEAWIDVAEGGAWAITDAEGRFELPDLAPGTWDVRVWHPQTGLHEQAVTVPEDGPASLYRSFGE